MKIAVVILNWNGKKLLEQFLPSVIEFSSEASIYVADNASTDTSIPYLKEHFPTIKIIENKENGGYAQGYNDALKQVKEEVYCLLNSDVEVTDGWLHPIVKLFNSNSSIAAIQPKIKDFKNKTHFEYAGAAGGFIDKFGYPYCRGRIFDTLEEDYGQYNDSIPVFWATGACLFVKADVLILWEDLTSIFLHTRKKLIYAGEYKTLDIAYIIAGFPQCIMWVGQPLAKVVLKSHFLIFETDFISY